MINALDYEPATVRSTQSISAAALLHKSSTAAAFSLNDKTLDALFQAIDASAAGLPGNHVLEISAAPGLGKTRWCIAFAVHSLLHENTHHVLFVDTEGHASPREIYNVALESTKRDPDQATDICKNIHCMRVSRQDAFLALLSSLPTWLDAHPLVRLVVIDCLSSPLRLAQFPVLLPAPQAFDSQNQMRTHALAELRRTLTYLCAQRNDYTFVVSTQMATKFGEAAGQRSAILEPQLGTAWHPVHASFRLVLYATTSGERTAQLVGAPFATKSQTAVYRITPQGMIEGLQ